MIHNTHINTAERQSAQPTAWRQKWLKIVDGKNTNEYFYTWHDSSEEADTFVGEYFENFNNSLPNVHYSPVEHANKKPCSLNTPRGEFIQAIILAS